MRSFVSFVVLSFASLLFQADVRAQDVVVPAGTLFHCTLDEPSLSSASASVGDPVVCHLSSLREFGHIVFPRGSYLGGHVESFKEPGHFFGKGNITLTFDRIGLPTTDIPVPSKVVGADKFRVDRKGEIVGHGHPTRDTIEWLFPPLWPWKVITLPARGPRPTLKGEEQLTLRLMDDVVIPRNLSASNLLGDSNSGRPASASQPAAYSSLQDASIHSSPLHKIYYAPPSMPAMEDEAGPPLSRMELASVTNPSAEYYTQPNHLTFIALKSGPIYAVTHFQVDQGGLSYEFPSGIKGSIDLPDIDWRQTSQLNSNRDNVAATMSRR